MGVAGLAIASDIGMAISVVTLAILLHKYRLVHIQGLEYAELGKALVASLLSYAGVAACLRTLKLSRGHRADFIAIAIGTIVWAAVGGGVLVVTRSKLPAQLLRRKARG
jgi:putative peptidoglycan lipid II flippase